MKKNNNLEKVILILAILVVVAGIAYAGYKIYQKLTVKIPNPIATMEVEGYGTIKIELYPDKAPNTVANFICLANSGFYNNSTFHRTIPDFVIQGGSKDGDGDSSATYLDLIKGRLDDYAVKVDDMEKVYKVDDAYYSSVTENIGKEIKKSGKKYTIKNLNELEKDYTIEGEFVINGYEKNNLRHEKGVISMARSDYSDYGLTTEGYNSAGSQFFIMTEDNFQLDGGYAAFGRVIEGLDDVVEKISNVEVYYRESELKEGEKAPTDEDGATIASDTPKEEPKITSVTVETFGVDYGVPETQEPFDLYSWLLQQWSN